MKFNFQMPAIQTDALEVLERKPEVRAATPGQHVKQRIAKSAAELNRAGQMAARVEVVNEALCRLTQLVYMPDSDSAFANICNVTYRLLIPAPWGSAGWQYWGLRYWEGKMLRYILHERQNNFKAGQRPPLYTYDEIGRIWHVNVPDYPTVESAGFWLRGSSITLKEWRRCGERYRDGVATMRRRYSRR